MSYQSSGLEITDCLMARDLQFVPRIPRVVTTLDDFEAKWKPLNVEDRKTKRWKLA